jgi:hypothetical protein
MVWIPNSLWRSVMSARTLVSLLLLLTAFSALAQAQVVLTNQSR